MNNDLDADHYRMNSSIQYKLAREVLDEVDFSNAKNILDIGCGDGRLTAEISKALPQAHIIGVDPSSNMIDLANQSFSKAKYPNLEFIKSSAEELKIFNNVDTLLMMNSLHWIREPRKAFENLFGYLSSKGKIYILTYPKESPFWNFLEATLEEEPWQSFKSSSAFNTIGTTDEYHSILIGLGLEIEECRLEPGIASFESNEALIKYIKGWLPSYVTLPSDMQDTFLVSAVRQARLLSTNRKDLRLPYLKLILKAQKK